MAGDDMRINAGVFEPEDVANLRSGLDRAWNALPSSAGQWRTWTFRLPKSCVSRPSASMILSGCPSRVESHHARGGTWRAMISKSSSAAKQLYPRDLSSFRIRKRCGHGSQNSKKVYAPGRTIRVTNQLGEMIIRLGLLRPPLRIFVWRPIALQVVKVS